MSGDRECLMPSVTWYLQLLIILIMAMSTVNDGWHVSQTAMRQSASARCCGALLCRHQWIVMPKLYCAWVCHVWPVPWYNSANINCISPWSYLRVLLMRHAAAFSACCSLSVMDLCEPATTMLQHSTGMIV